ncbi:MAG TPA: hypothetical protein DCL69_03475 [Firmicutes bacterium]|nr:hypothetical protein [Bacillota bacterium]
MAMMRLTFTPAEFQQIVDYYGFACEVTSEQLKIYLLSLKRRTTYQAATFENNRVKTKNDATTNAKTNTGTDNHPNTNTITLPDLTDRETILQELMKAESQLASISMKYRESDEKATLLERARGAMLEENALLKKELRRLSWENGQLRQGIADPLAPPEIETLDTQEIIKGWGNSRQPKRKSLWDRITGK